MCSYSSCETSSEISTTGRIPEEKLSNVLGLVEVRTSVLRATLNSGSQRGGEREFCLQGILVVLEDIFGCHHGGIGGGGSGATGI